MDCKIDIATSLVIKDLKQEDAFNVLQRVNQSASWKIWATSSCMNLVGTVRTTQCTTCLRHSVKRGTIYCGMWHVLDTIARTNRQNQKYNWHPCRILHASSKRGKSRRTPWTWRVAVPSLEGRGCCQKLQEARVWVYREKNGMMILSYRETQQEHNEWTLEYSMFLELLQGRSRSTTRLLEENEFDTQNQLCIEMERFDRILGKMSIHEEFYRRQSNHVLRWLTQQGRGNASFPPQSKIQTKTHGTPAMLRPQLRGIHASNGQSSSVNVIVESATWWRTPAMARTTSVAKNDKIGMRWQEWDEWVQISWIAKSLCTISWPVSGFFVGHVAYRH